MFGLRFVFVSAPFVVAFFFAFGPCALASPDARAVRDLSSLRMTLERDPCLSTCPYYRVEIVGDGTVTYEGFDCVAIKGERIAHIDDADVKKLFALYEATDFWSLQDRYRGHLPDAPGYIVSLAYDGSSKSVLDYLGTSAGMPKAVQDLEDAIDAAANVKQWLWGTRSCSGRITTDP